MAGRRNGQDSESFSVIESLCRVSCCCCRSQRLLLPEPAVVRGLPFWGPAGHGNSTFEGTTRECIYGCPTRKQKGGCARLKRYILGCVRWAALLVDNQRMFVRVGSHRQSMLMGSANHLMISLREQVSVAAPFVEPPAAPHSPFGVLLSTKRRMRQTEAIYLSLIHI